MFFLAHTSYGDSCEVCNEDSLTQHCKNISAALMCEQADIGTYPFNTLPRYILHLNFDMGFWKAFSVGIMRNYAMGIFYQPSSKTRMSLLFFR